MSLPSLAAPSTVRPRTGRTVAAFGTGTRESSTAEFAGAAVISAAAPVVSLRSAAAADDREFALGRALSRIGTALAAGQVVDVLWPAAREAAWANTALGLPLAQHLVALAAAAAPGGVVILHTRAGSADDFLALAPSPSISLVFHLNAEEAALRWERGEASPGRRLMAASRLAAAGWTTWLCVGPVRLFDGWKDEYADIAERAAAAGFGRLLVTFPGEDLLDQEAAPAGSDGVKPILTESGYRLTIPPRQRREIQLLLNSRLTPTRAAA